MLDKNPEKRPSEDSESSGNNKKVNIDDIQSDVDNSLNLEQIRNGADDEPIYFNGVELSKLTKRQMKKYKKCLKWQDVKKEKRAKEKLKMKEKRLHAKLNNIDLGPRRKELKRMKMKNSPCKIGICVDLAFDELMIDKDMAKTIKQILRMYSLNRRAKAPMQLHLSSFNGKSEKEMSRHNGYEHWDINFHKEDYIDIFPKEKLVYLSSESDNVITKLDEDKIYIIGGLVDHNSQKGICYRKAVEQGIDHAQLPIGEYFWMKARKVLTINQVFEILLSVSEGKTFKEAFEMVLPKRKEIVSTEDLSNSETEEPSDAYKSLREGGFGECSSVDTSKRKSDVGSSKKVLDLTENQSQEQTHIGNNNTSPKSCAQGS